MPENIEQDSLLCALRDKFTTTSVTYGYAYL